LRSIGGILLILGAVLGVLGVIAWTRATQCRVSALAFHWDGIQLAVGRLDESVRLLNLESEEVWKLSAGGAAIRALAFGGGKDGEEVAAIDAAGTITLWHLQTCQARPLMPYVGHGVTTAAFSPDGRWLACAVGGTWITRLRHLADRWLRPGG